MASELQSGRQQLAALRAENGALKQQKTQSGQKDKKVTEEKLAAAEVPLMSSLTSHNGDSQPHCLARPRFLNLPTNALYGVWQRLARC